MFLIGLDEGVADTVDRQRLLLRLRLCLVFFSFSVWFSVSVSVSYIDRLGILFRYAMDSGLAQQLVPSEQPIDVTYSPRRIPPRRSLATSRFRYWI